MRALQAHKGASRTGPDPIGTHRGGQAMGKTEVDRYASAQNRMTEAMIAMSQPGDQDYARLMAKIYDLSGEGFALHVGMYEAYEDGLPAKAAMLARRVADIVYELADLHANLAAAFDTIVPFTSKRFNAVHMLDRHPSNITIDLSGVRDDFIDDEYTRGDDGH